MNRFVHIILLIVLAPTSALASEVTQNLPAGSGQQYANTYYDTYITQGRTPCPSTVGINARAHASNLDAMMEGLAAEMAEAGDLDGFADYFWSVLDTGGKCGDVLDKVPNPIVSTIGSAISKGTQLTKSATQPGGCLALSSTQKDIYKLYLEAQAAKTTWDAVGAACP